ncbi:MAG: ADP-ribosylglycohydrolase family protein [Actinomycetia bacterium]|nr:ADP-ribosylglycohydrolase family protein [Actinomycetes bacterium]
MLGAIIGDIVGSRFEFHNLKSKDFELFSPDCFFTDDSVMTLAIAQAILDTVKAHGTLEPDNAEHFYQQLASAAVKNMQAFGRSYPSCGYGARFAKWLDSSDPRPYQSYGNGAAMRVSPAGLAARTEAEAMRLAEAVTAVTHNHPEGIKGAQATAVAVFLLRRGVSKADVRERISCDFYPLDFTIDAIRPSYNFHVSCQSSVPQAIQCYLESQSFEDALRIAVSLGGDSDTIAAIAGSLAEADYGIPADIRTAALPYLDDKLCCVLDEWQEVMCR